jgi:hypothetical protein
MSTVTEKKLTINYLAVVALTIAYQVVMMGWYTLFSEQWIALQGKTEADFADPSPMPFIVAVGTAFVMVYVLAWAFTKMNVRTGIDGLKTAFILGFGLYALQLLTQYLFSSQPVGLAMIDGGGVLVTFLISGYVLGAWKKEA